MAYECCPALAIFRVNMCVEVANPATPATRLNFNHLTRNITRNTGATTRNNQSHSVHIQDKSRIGEHRKQRGTQHLPQLRVQQPATHPQALLIHVRQASSVSILFGISVLVCAIMA